MTSTQGGEAHDKGSRSLRPWVIVGFVVVIILAVVGLGAVWLFFFGSEAPPAPTLDDALGALRSTAPAE